VNIRLQKYIADCGVASRRKAEEMIRAGKVKVNGVLVGSSDLGVKVDPAKDKVEVDGSLISSLEKRIYIKLNKPRGYVSSCVSQKGEATICDLLKGVKERLYPVGRLDQASEGLMLLTNDGEMANKLMHPRYEHEKEYLVTCLLPVSSYQLKNLQSGIVIEGEKTRPAQVKLLDHKEFSIILREGKKRQIRRMMEEVGNKVKYLKRVRIKNIQLGSLSAGKFAYLSQAEINDLLS
jgi:pseudouridine synthase